MAWSSADLVSALRRQVLILEADLRTRVDGEDHSLRQSGVWQAWESDYNAAFAAQRTAATWSAWRDERVTQSAVAWVLLTVFARYCEDNALVNPRWIGGADPDQRTHALDARRAYFQAHPEHTDREWLHQIIEHFAKFSATAALVDSFSPLHLVAPSGDAARGLLEFWWQQGDGDAAGQPRYSFTGVDTRFLGDAYQDLSEHAKKTYALLQTPDFVEEFILDQTLEPALADRPLEGFTVIDPTCGSGHFLLGAFDRLHERWQQHAPGLGARELVAKALDSVYGVDINPFAVAIARFRLLVAALHAAGDSSIEQNIGYRPHLAAGDSLLWGAPQQALDDDLFTLGQTIRADATENIAALKEILHRHHDAVVGNPPYIAVSDPALNTTYRGLYPTAYRQYALSVPFMELFFYLASPPDTKRPIGWVGQITSNSFMKREFGKRLVEEFLTTVDVRTIIDSEGAWIPGHNSDGTPTVILIGRNCGPSRPTIRTVLSLGSRETKETVGQPYWKSILEELDNPGFANEWIAVSDIQRKAFDKHPWTLSGGGAIDLLQFLDQATETVLADLAPDIGFVATTRADNAYELGRSTLERLQIGEDVWREFITGPNIRNWSITAADLALCPYNALGEPLADFASIKFLWPIKPQLEARRALSGTQLEQGREWWEYSQLNVRRYTAKLLITFSEIASHNHFVLTSGKRVFDRTAPVIVVPDGNLDTAFKLLAILNSSVIGFWLRQKCKPKGGSAAFSWARTYQFNVTKMKNIPIPKYTDFSQALELVELAQAIHGLQPSKLLAEGLPTAEELEQARLETERLRKLMIAHQEELDWQCYAAFGLISKDLTYAGEIPELEMGERAFEIALSRRAAGRTVDWLEAHSAGQVTDIPSRFPLEYSEVLGRRIEFLSADPMIRLLESPDYKRRWFPLEWDKCFIDALGNWLLKRIEHRDLWYDLENRPIVRSVGQLADLLDRDERFRHALSVWSGDTALSTAATLHRLLEGESVPYLSAYRYSGSGIAKRASWEAGWEARRNAEKRGLNSAIQGIPPDFQALDYRRPTYWDNRGKLDLPTERFISYPNAGRDTDPTELLGWAGWDHAEQALALASLVSARTEEGWDTPRLIPLLAGLYELAPWVRQWHNEIDPEYGESVADTIDTELAERLTEHRLTTTDLTTWRPAPTGRVRRATTS